MCVQNIWNKVSLREERKSKEREQMFCLYGHWELEIDYTIDEGALPGRKTNTAPSTPRISDNDAHIFERDVENIFNVCLYYTHANIRRCRQIRS